LSANNSANNSENAKVAGVRMVSRKLQQVSAAFASGVNPKVTGGRNLSLLAKNDNGPEPVVAAGTYRRDNIAGINMADNWSADLPACAIDIAQALRAGWLELWYQPKIGSQALDLRGAEALIRMRHPQLGIVQPANFMPATRDPHFRALSQFVIDQALADWRYFRAEQRQVDMSINLPISFLNDPASVEYLCRQLPDDPAFDGLIVEVDGGDITRDLPVARAFAKQARLQKVAISIDRLGGEGAALAELRDFPFVEIKVDRELISGCADDRSKRRLCQHIVDVAGQFGARTVAVGVETHADFAAARELGFDLVQGFLFAKPMGVRTFLRTMPPE
jgi:EAL domain-containing protein (putative c-di-GMP-specific phosphodiesterase class I)